MCHAQNAAGTEYSDPASSPGPHHYPGLTSVPALFRRSPRDADHTGPQRLLVTAPYTRWRAMQGVSSLRRGPLGAPASPRRPSLAAHTQRRLAAPGAERGGAGRAGPRVAAGSNGSAGEQAGAARKGGRAYLLVPSGALPAKASPKLSQAQAERQGLREAHAQSPTPLLSALPVQARCAGRWWCARCGKPPRSRRRRRSSSSRSRRSTRCGA